MHLNPEEQRRWLQHLGKRVSWCPDRTLLPISIDDLGAIIVDAPERRALYLVVDADDEVVYVGKVDRCTGSVAERFRDHHAYQPDWDRLWVIPISNTQSPESVLDWETALIQHFDPPYNKVGRKGRDKW